MPNAISKTINDATQRYCKEGSEACFAAGTLVHTKEGLVPIEKIKVGDWVLSKPENGGEQAYKRVLKTFAHEPTAVMSVGGAVPGVPLSFEPVTATLNHPFWVADKGWTAARDLPEGFNTDGEKFELHDGSHTRVGLCTPIFVSEQPGVGWIPSMMGDLTDVGVLWDYANRKFVARDVKAIERIQELESEHPLYKQMALEEAEKSEDNYPYLKLPVYNLEVEDFHTYYVGEIGIWVHNTNCGGLSFEVKGGEVLSEAMTSRP